MRKQEITASFFCTVLMSCVLLVYTIALLWILKAKLIFFLFLHTSSTGHGVYLDHSPRSWVKWSMLSWCLKASIKMTFPSFSSLDVWHNPASKCIYTDCSLSGPAVLKICERQECTAQNIKNTWCKHCSAWIFKISLCAFYRLEIFREVTQRLRSLKKHFQAMLIHNSSSNS